jgi:hypothetical protein
MPDYGRDFMCLTGIDPMLRTVTGIPLMCQVALHRLYCRRGALLSNPNDATLDARDFIGKGVSTDADLITIQGLCVAALLGDDRISSATVTARFNSGTQRLELTVRGTGSDGPFFLVLSVSALTVEVLKAA